METWIDITTPTSIRTHVSWPNGATYPSQGDTVLLRVGQQTWSFQVTQRLLAIGTNPQTGAPACQLSLTVDTEPPRGFAI